MPSCVKSRGEDNRVVDLKGTYLSVGWGESSEIRKNEAKMLRVNKSFVSETVDQLCSRNTVLNKLGVTRKQLHAVLTLQLNQTTSSHGISLLIEKAEQSKNIIRNNFGNYIMNPDCANPVEEDKPDCGKEISSLMPEPAVNSISSEIDSPSNRNNENKDVSNCSSSPNKAESNEKAPLARRGRIKKEDKGEEDCEEDDEEIEECSPLPSPSSTVKAEPEEDEDDKPLAKRRGRKRKPKAEVKEGEEEDDGEGDEGSLSSQDKMEVEELKPEPKKRGRKKKIIPKVEKEEEEEDDEDNIEEAFASPSQRNKSMTSRVVVSTSNGRRVIRKITKYDPSEYYLTPLIRKKAKNVVAELPKKRLKRGRPPLKPKPDQPVPSFNLKKNEPPKCYGKSGKSPLESVKSTAVKNKSGENSINDYDSDDDSSSDVDSSCGTIPVLTLVKSKASMLRNECYLCCREAQVSDEASVMACSLCLNIAHEQCVKDDGFYKKLKKWRCNQCLSNHPAVCFTCNKQYDKNDGVMLTCDNCEEMFHARCHIPFVRSPVLSAPWRCSFCPRLTLTDSLIGARKDLKSDLGTFAYNAESKLKPICTSIPEPGNKEELNGTAQMELEVQPEPTPVPVSPDVPVETTPVELVEIKEEPPDQIEEAEVIPKEEEEEVLSFYKYHRPGEAIPTVDEWSSKEVADYFSIRFGPAVGNAFLAQEIDGRSLKLLKRDDVTQRLGLQFGIALKVLYYVKKIQLKTNVIHELWT